MSDSVQFNRVRGANSDNLTFFVDGEMYVVDDKHPNFQDIVEACEDDDGEEAVHLTEIAPGLKEVFAPLTERVSIDDDTVYFDGDVADNAITEAMIRYQRDGEEGDLLALANFFEKLSTNPSGISRNQLYKWLQTHDFTLLEDGDILAYKGVLQPDNDGIHHSIHAGTALVDGEVKTGNIPNPPGSVIEMPRSQVNEDPSVPCAKGLHVGTWSFAKTFGRGPVLAISVNPRDIVSVPSDANNQKVRTCRYRVLEVVHQQDDRLSRKTTTHRATPPHVPTKTPKSWMDKVKKN